MAVLSLRARLITQLLKAAYPHVRFSIREGPTTRRSVTGVSVSWTNGPTERRVKQLVAHHQPKSVLVFRTVKPTHLRLVQ